MLHFRRSADVNKQTMDMLGNYKCHRKQEIKIYCCINCFVIVHKSCWDRQSNWTHVDKHKIYCSLNCKLEGEERLTGVEHLEELKTICNELETEVEQKDEFIKKQEQRWENLRSEAIDMEQSLNYKIENYKNQVLLLQQDLNKTKKELSTLCNQKINYVERSCQTTSTEYKNIMMQTDPYPQRTVSSQSQTTQSCPQQTCNTQTEPDDDIVEEMLLTRALLKIHVARSTQTETQTEPGKTGPIKTQSQNPEKISARKRKPQLLLVSNTFLKGSTNWSKEFTDGNFDINNQYLKNCTFNDVMQDALSRTKKLNSNDKIILFCGPQNALKNHNIDLNLLHHVVNNTSHTHLMIVSCPLTKNRPVLNQFILKHNAKIEEALEATRASFIDAAKIVFPQNVMSYDICWNVNNRRQLFLHISEEYIFQKTKQRRINIGTSLNNELSYVEENKKIMERLKKLRQPSSTNPRITILQNMTLKRATSGKAAYKESFEAIDISRSSTPINETNKIQNKTNPIHSFTPQKHYAKSYEKGDFGSGGAAKNEKSDGRWMNNQHQTPSRYLNKYCFFRPTKHYDTGWGPTYSSTQY